ncbi:ABC transporter ATP-binding protein [Demetria terragena]|uniref:ABC transporter ATP-binding protein n=1 Tax=Demetria terragena TaxID=63959 RepID=UPI000381AC3D|nr:ABC transporter ATP-binding protein [Demetria terragena]
MSLEWKTSVGEPVISVENLGIEFLRGRKRKLSLREMVYTRKTTHNKDTFWPLEDISFEVGRGEGVGLVGGNGEGKSTLLKLIAGTLLPDRGRAVVREGVAPLIELTGGFVGDLSARENVYLTAALHGMSEEQIEERFEEIVKFAGPQVKAGLDAPFRHFSSGMQVRLGFAVITCLDEPIILVDEVLAVGDKKFREKCYDRMEGLLEEGRTLFLVSHNERDLKRFCTRGIYLRQGLVAADGQMNDVIAQYNEDILSS